MTERIITRHISPYVAVQGLESEVGASTAPIGREDYERGLHDGIKMAMAEVVRDRRIPSWVSAEICQTLRHEASGAAEVFSKPAVLAVKTQVRDFTSDARSWPVLTQKYLRRWPESKKAQYWRGKAVHIQTENGVWRKGGCGYTCAGAPNAGLWIFEEAVKRIAHCGPEKRGAFILVPVEALAALEGGAA